MPVTITWGTKTINVPQSYLTFVSGITYELDVNQLRLDLKDLEDSEQGIMFPITHNHNTEVTLSGVTYARIVEFINGYVVDFTDDVTPGDFFIINCVGANHNLADVLAAVHRHYALIVNNAAGLIVKTIISGSGLDAGQDALLTKIGNIVEADEEIRATTFKKFIKGTTTVLVNKNVTKVGNDVDLTEP